MKKEIGSYFWLKPEDLKNRSEQFMTPEIFGCKGSDFVWLSTGRSAIALTIQTIERRNPNIKRRVCLPSFTCHTVIEPFLKTGYEIIPIPVDRDLHISSEILIKYTEGYHPGVIILHRYFGFDTLDMIDYAIHEIRKKGIIVIEDITQCLYSNIPRLKADYYIGSIRKWCSVPDGAFAVCSSDKFVSKPNKSDTLLERQKIEASLLKHKYIEEGSGDKTTFLQKYTEAENTITTQNEIYKISPLSYQMQSNLDVDSLSQKRRHNYRLLLNEIKYNRTVTPIFNYIDDNITPLYFPIYCNNREEFRNNLIRHDIYAPIVWPKSKNLPNVDKMTNYIYDHILCLPIDQRYGHEEMTYIASVIKDYDKLVL